MVKDPQNLIDAFLGIAKKRGLVQPSSVIRHESLQAPHAPPRLPPGMCAVYVFSLSESYGRTCPAGQHRVLKVGKVGSKSQARFQYQHYNPSSAQSNLAATLLSSQVLWPYLGIADLSTLIVADWIREKTDRDHFFLSAEDAAALSQLERYLRGHLGPAFEGG